jgi:hypothetical protein
MSRDEILLELRKNADEKGDVEFKFSDDLLTKKQELNALKSLADDGYIQRLTASIGYAIYRVL